MRNGLPNEFMRQVSRFAVIGALGGLGAACSADTMRFAENPFSNPFATASASAEPPLTGSIDGAPRAAPMPRARVERAPLAPVAAAPLAPSRTASGWTTEGGTSITVGRGDSLAGIAGRYGVPAGAILSANGLAAQQVVPGRRLVVPVYGTAAAPVRAAPAVAGLNPAAVNPRPAAPAPAAPAAGRVLSSSPLPPKVAPRSVAEAATAKPRARPTLAAPAKPEPTRMAARVAEPKTVGSIEPKRVTEARPAAKPVAAAKAEPARTAKAEPIPAPVRAKAEPVAPAKVVAKAEPAKPVKAEPVKVARAPAPEPVKPAPAPTPAPVPAKEPESTASVAPASEPKAEFRWPAKGRVITGFGGSGSNEGVNIAVPEGTPVKAAEGGTVAYAGSEVKGYGNLVLIRHDNGYVSAYAHNGDIDVKRGQKVTRGQTIAKSGQSGNVTSPQLHFEIRKGSTPVDPMKYLASN